MPTAPPARLGLRDRQRIEAREQVLRACAELAIRHRGLQDPEQYTFARIAELAGMSERTVYRLFPTKQELHEAFEREHVLSGGRALPADPREFPEFLRSVVRELETEFPAPADPAAETIADDPGRRQRDDAVAVALRPLIDDELSLSREHALVSVLRRVVSVRSVVETADRFPTTLADAAAAQAWAAGVLIKALERGEGPEWPDP